MKVHIYMYVGLFVPVWFMIMLLQYNGNGQVFAGQATARSSCKLSVRHGKFAGPREWWQPSIGGVACTKASSDIFV